MFLSPLEVGKLHTFITLGETSKAYNNTQVGEWYRKTNFS